MIVFTTEVRNVSFRLSACNWTKSDAVNLSQGTLYSSHDVKEFRLSCKKCAILVFSFSASSFCNSLFGIFSFSPSGNGSGVSLSSDSNRYSRFSAQE